MRPPCTRSSDRKLDMPATAKKEIPLLPPQRIRNCRRTNKKWDRCLYGQDSNRPRCGPHSRKSTNNAPLPGMITLNVHLRAAYCSRKGGNGAPSKKYTGASGRTSSASHQPSHMLRAVAVAASSRVSYHARSLHCQRAIINGTQSVCKDRRILPSLHSWPAGQTSCKSSFRFSPCSPSTKGRCDQFPILHRRGPRSDRTKHTRKIRGA